MLAALGINLSEALIATWPDRAAMESLRMIGEELQPTADYLARQIKKSLGPPMVIDPMAEAVLEFDDGSSPWHTICEIRVADRLGLLSQLAVAFAATRVEVRGCPSKHPGDSPRSV